MLFRFMQKCGLSSSRAYCIFLKSTNRNVQNVLLLKSRMGNWTKPLLLAGWAKIQYARDDERPHFCINLNKNIDSEVYCNANEFPNISSINYDTSHVAYWCFVMAYMSSLWCHISRDKTWICHYVGGESIWNDKLLNLNKQLSSFMISWYVH
jgi:hypothetical protein